MIPFSRRDDGIHLTLASGERAVLANLAEQLQQILAGDVATDPVSERLFPSAYPDDADDAEEFRRYTFEDLHQQKAANVRVVLAWLTGASDGAFSYVDEQAWLRCLTDLRLTIANRLGIDDHDPWEDDDPDQPDAEGLGLRDVYDWLGYVQEHLVVTISG
jgi:hypothetical protein